MRIKINSKSIKVTDGMVDTVDLKFNVFKKFLDESDEIKITVTSIKKEIIVSTIFIYKGKLVKVEKSGDDFYFIIDDIVDTLKDKLEKLHTKEIKKNKDQEKVLQKMFNETEVEEEYMHKEIIAKRKKIELIPLSPEEAIEKMEELGHESYIFMNIESNKPCMIYCRNDGKYGLLET